MNLQLAQAIQTKIQEANSIVILRHESPDPDALGSQEGLKQMILATYPDKKVYLLGDMPESLSYITRMDHIDEQVYQQSLVIVLDCANTPRIDSPFTVNPDQVIKIDHHPNDDAYGLICYVDTTASSTCEILSEMAFGEGLAWSMNKEGANALYAGIVGDTGRFLYPSTTAKTFAVVSKLLEYEVDLSGIADHMITRSLAASRLAGYTYQNLQILPSGVATITYTSDLMKEFGIDEEEAHSLVSLPSTIDGVLCWCIFVQQEDGIYRCNLRSKGPIINTIAKKHNGGGHPLASGAKIDSLEEMQEMIHEFDLAAQEYLAQK